MCVLAVMARMGERKRKKKKKADKTPTTLLLGDCWCRICYFWRLQLHSHGFYFNSVGYSVGSHQDRGDKPCSSWPSQTSPIGFVVAHVSFGFHPNHALLIRYW